MQRAAPSPGGNLCRSDRGARPTLSTSVTRSGNISAVRRIINMRPGSLALLGRISSPHPFNGVRQELRLGVANAVARVSAEEVLVLIALGLQHLGHAVVG